MAHAKYFMLLEKKRWLAPIPAKPQKVLDLACGTGHIDFADANPSAEVIGVDIAPIQPKCRNPPSRQARTPKSNNSNNRHLKPGGWLEFQCIDGSLKCDDGTVPETSQFKEYDRLLRAAATAFGTPLEDPTGYAKWFEGAGFEGVTERVFKMPTNPWPKDPRLRLVGALEQENLTGNLEGISTRVFQKGLGWGADESSVFFAAVRKDIKNRRHHSYYPFYVVYGQKPLLTAT
ncbi:putative methyltransferase tdiE [Lachnellula cervina]|uniref:Putative methyltransferase tdiE n=1 Tax=Lachnellula cervina TaxID=1316786 RepID=A0A7D8UIR9_9HELO|nr:putative methyltransferase tdiE [Lachnellula cervina]